MIPASLRGAAPLPVQLLANVPGKAAEGGPWSLGPCTRVDGAPGSGFSLAIAAIWGINQQMGEILSLALPSSK